MMLKLILLIIGALTVVTGAAYVLGALLPLPVAIVGTAATFIAMVFSVVESMEGS